MDETALTTARKELQAARTARREGFEGRSRVNARRAVAALLTGYYRETTGSAPTQNGYALIEYASQDLGLPAEIRSMLVALCTRVNIDFSLDSDMDLLIISETLLDFFAGGTFAPIN